MKIAIQKSGRLNELSNNILLQKNIYLPQQLERKLIIDLPPNKIYLLRDDDIPNLVNLNVADCGIVGNDVLDEYLDQQTQNNIKIVKKLNDQKCRLSIASKTKTLNLNDLNGKTIATSFPNTLRK
jgi:ATP phosphoribosyltransferase